MSNRNSKIWLLSCILCAWPLALSAQQDEQEILTLFTTQQERRLIDENRYRQSTVIKPKKNTDEETAEQKQIKIYRQQNASFELAGVTLSEDGNHYAWINGDRVQSGDKIDNGVKVIINPKLDNLVQIKTPDGVYHNLQAGETITVKYLQSGED